MEDQTPAYPEDTSKIHKDVPKCLWSPVFLHYNLSSSLHLWPHEEFPMISWQRNRKFWPCFCMICTHHWKVNSYSTTAPFWDLWRTTVKGNPVRRQNFKHCTSWLFVCLGIKITRYEVIHILIHGLWPMFSLDGQGFVIKMIQKLMARGCEKQIYIRTLLGKHVKFFVSHVICHAKSLQSCLTLCNLMYYSLPDSFGYEILPAWILECVAMTSSRGSSRPKDWTCISYISCIDRWVLYL